MELFEFKKAFENNFYLSEEYIQFCETVSEISRDPSFKNQGILKNKNISIHSYNDLERENMIKKEIHFLSVSLKDNSKEKDPSFMEYPVWYYKPYEKAYKSFDKTFRKYIKRVEKNNFTTQIIRISDKNTINQVYKLYIQHMKRLNGFLFPKSFFSTFLKNPSSLLFLVFDKHKLIGYSFCFENKNNLYASVGAGHKEYFDKYINYKLYHEKIKYACKNKLNIHMGMGTKDSGYNKFKKRTGAICLKCIKYPDNEGFIKKILPLTRYTFTGLIFRLFSRLAPKKVVFISMPFT